MNQNFVVAAILVILATIAAIVAMRKPKKPSRISRSVQPVVEDALAPNLDTPPIFNCNDSCNGDLSCIFLCEKRWFPERKQLEANPFIIPDEDVDNPRRSCERECHSSSGFCINECSIYADRKIPGFGNCMKTCSQPMLEVINANGKAVRGMTCTDYCSSSP